MLETVSFTETHTDHTPSLNQKSVTTFDCHKNSVHYVLYKKRIHLLQRNAFPPPTKLI